MILEVILLIGLTLLTGTLGAKVCQKFKFPQVTGYILIGLLLGSSGLNLWSLPLLERFNPIVSIALGMIGFKIGSELRSDAFKKRARSIYTILFSEVFCTFLIVMVVMFFVTGKFYYGLIFGALATATAPAATVDVLWEYKCRGPLTSTLLAIVALDDLLALLVYGFAGVFAKSLITHEHYSLWQLIRAPFADVGAAALIGGFGAVVLRGLLRFIKDRKRILPFSLAFILIAVGLSEMFKVDLILSSMILGFVLGNMAPNVSNEIRESLETVSSPIYILFFVMVGARLDLTLFATPMILGLTGAYIISRGVGKIGGSFLGGLLGGAQIKVTRFLGFGLFSQAGVAIGMAFSINQYLSHAGPAAGEIGLMIVNVVVAATFIFQLAGPLFVKFAVSRAGEMYRDVTEEDVIDSLSLHDVLEKDIPTIPETMHLDDMVEMVKESESNDFCVVDEKGRLLGCISLGDLRAVLLEQEAELNRLILARDIAVPPAKIIRADQPLKKAVQILRRRDLDFLPVVQDEDTGVFVGLVHYKILMSRIAKEVIQRRGSE